MCVGIIGSRYGQDQRISAVGNIGFVLAGIAVTMCPERILRADIRVDCALRLSENLLFVACIFTEIQVSGYNLKGNLVPMGINNYEKNSWRWEFVKFPPEILIVFKKPMLSFCNRSIQFMIINMLLDHVIPNTCVHGSLLVAKTNYWPAPIFL
jgi:hypothetical protein